MNKLGKVIKTIPIDRVQDVEVVEPAGTVCCCFVQNVLHSVAIQTAGSSGAPEATLVGLKDPLSFREAVLALKEGMPMSDGMSSSKAGGGQGGKMFEVMTQLAEQN